MTRASLPHLPVSHTPHDPRAGWHVLTDHGEAPVPAAPRPALRRPGPGHSAPWVSPGQLAVVITEERVGGLTQLLMVRGVGPRLRVERGTVTVIGDSTVPAPWPLEDETAPWTWLLRAQLETTLGDAADARLALLGANGTPLDDPLSVISMIDNRGDAA